MSFPAGLKNTFFEGATSTNVTGGTFLAAATGSIVNLAHGGQPAISAAFRDLSAAAAHTALHDSSARHNAPRCYRNTRAKQLDRLERWMRGLGDGDGDERIIWLCGGAGAGKSAIMQSTIERCSPHGVVLGSVFFFRSDPSRNSAEVLIPTLAYQVARAFPEAMTILEPIITGDPLIFKASLLKQAYELLVRPILYLIENGFIGKTAGTCGVFFIDGLDECGDGKAQALIIDVVASMIQEHSLPVMFLIASRPEPAINDQFRRRFNADTHFATLFLEDDEDAKADIRHFIEDSFLDVVDFHPLKDHIKLPWPSDRSIQHLVHKSSGHFVYAAIAMKYISSHDEHPMRALEVVEGLKAARTGSPFVELDALYGHILASAKYHEQVMNILRLMCLTPFDCDVDVVSFFLNVTPADLFLFLMDVQALVSFPSPQHPWLRCRHTSLQDFIRDKARSHALHISSEAYHASLLTVFFDLLWSEDRDLQGFKSSSWTAERVLFKKSMVYEGGSRLVFALCKAITSSSNIDTLDTLIRRTPPWQIWNFCNRYSSEEVPLTLSIARYMSAIRDSAANQDNELYLYHFPAYVDLLHFVAASKMITGYEWIVPAFLFSSSSHELHIVQPLLNIFYEEFNISKIYACYLVHLVDSSHASANTRTWEALSRMPHINAPWGIVLATAMVAVLKQLLHQPRIRLSHSQSQLDFDYYAHVYGQDDTSWSHTPEPSSALSISIMEDGYQCSLLLKAVMFFLRKANCTAELAELARESLPEDALSFPTLMAEARSEMDAYVVRWEDSLEALFERTKSWVINDLD